VDCLSEASFHGLFTDLKRTIHHRGHRDHRGKQLKKKAFLGALCVLCGYKYSHYEFICSFSQKKMNRNNEDKNLFSRRDAGAQGVVRRAGPFKVATRVGGLRSE
jgi:hypothetical protein